jgi:hypothetical protein
MKQLVLILTIVILLFVYSFSKIELVYPNYYFLGKDYSYKNREEVLKDLSKLLKEEVKIKIKNRVYKFTAKELGVDFDINQTLSAFFSQDQKNLWEKVVLFKNQLYGKKVVRPVVVFNPLFFERVENLRFDFTKEQDKVVIDRSRQELNYVDNKEVYGIDIDDLKTQISLHYGRRVVLTPKLVSIVDNRKELEIENVNEKLRAVFEDGVEVVLNSKNNKININPGELRRITEIIYSEDAVSLAISTTELEKLLIRKGYGAMIGDERLDIDLLRNNLENLTVSRYGGNKINEVAGVMRQSANTAGKKADKYIEIDISQQMMYLWEQGENIAMHRVSSGLYYPTPPGEYEILNKANNAYSYIYHVWMPYWMAFSLDKTVNAYLGIHELPYWIDSGGQEIRRPRDFIGSPHTGGCVSLDVGEAKAVYDWAEVGTKVVIYN